LSNVGYRVDSAPDGQTALQAVRDHIFDAVMLDFSLPDMNGLMVHREIRQMDQELAANTIFMSGHVQSDQNLGYYTTYGVDFLSKPFKIDEVVDSLESLWT
jgi:DNA-binding response OmpR family regulator